MLDAGVPIFGIGVKGHLHGDSFDATMLQKSLDDLSQFKLPICITELNFPGPRSKSYTGDKRAVMPPEEEQAKAEALTQFYTNGFAHPSVTGIMMWSFWEGANWTPQSSLYKRTGRRCRRRRRTKTGCSISGGPGGVGSPTGKGGRKSARSMERTRSR
jgi:endo-1,4-beta-xylanase